MDDPPGVSFGADAAIDEKRRQLALAQLQTAIDEQRRMAEPDSWKQQRANIAEHGTIEMPDAYTRRMRTTEAADLIDPANPLGRLRADEQAHDLEKLYVGNVVPRLTDADTRMRTARESQQTTLERQRLANEGAAARGRSAAVDAFKREMYRRLSGLGDRTDAESTLLEGLMREGLGASSPQTTGSGPSPATAQGASDDPEMAEAIEYYMSEFGVDKETARALYDQEAAGR